MSKKRPSKSYTPLALVKEKPASWWGRRLFKNTYTYKGKRIKLKAWSVKMQHANYRRTFALKSRLRAAAAREAAELYSRIVTQGWGFVKKSVRRRKPLLTAAVLKDSSPKKTTIEYWENSLLQKRYPVSVNPGLPFEWCARIEHNGVSSYFPLGTADPKAAAKKALAIYNLVMASGWETACEEYAREVTIGIHWINNPVAWTYTTFHTEMADRASHPQTDIKPVLKVAIIEPNQGIRRALRHWLETAPDISCVGAYATYDDVLQHAPPNQKELWLVNRTLSGISGKQCLEQMRRLTPDLCGVIYAVYEDSNELFLATPGGASGYMLKRTAPEKLLELLTRPSSKPLSQKEILFRVRQYFQGPQALISTGEPDGALETLTLREKEILQLLSQGCLDKEIAAKAGLSIWTVHEHMKNIFQKLDVHTRTEAAVRFLQR